MTKQRFNNIERRSFFEAYNEKCFYCNRPLTYSEMQLDHLVPESLANDQNALDLLVSQTGLPRDYCVEADYNIVLACGACNSKKSSTVFNAAQIIILSTRATELSMKVAVLRQKYSRIVSNDRLVLNLVNAMEAHPSARTNLQTLLWEYYGNAQTPMSFPVRFLGREPAESLNKADLEDLWDRPVDLWGEGRSGLPVTHDDGREIEVHSCREYAAAVSAGFYPLTNTAIKMSSIFEYALAVFYALELGKPVDRFSLTGPRVGLCDLRFLDKSLAPTFGEGLEEEVVESPATTFEDLVALGEMEILEFTSLSIVFKHGGLITYFREILRTDINGDDKEEILTSVVSRADGGTLGFGYAVFLGRDTDTECFRDLQLRLPHSMELDN